MAIIAFDESHALVSLLDDGFEHNILLRKMKGTDENLDKYYRIIFDEDGADWTFVCPNDYEKITDKSKRISLFYKNGLVEAGCFADRVYSVI